MKLSMMWLVYVFGVLSVYFYTIFSKFSGNFVIKKYLMIYLAYMKLLQRNIYFQIIRLCYGTMESRLHGSSATTALILEATRFQPLAKYTLIDVSKYIMLYRVLSKRKHDKNMYLFKRYQLRPKLRLWEKAVYPLKKFF